MTHPTHKTCSSCNQSKPRGEFSRNIQTRDGLSYYCRVCASKKQREFRITHPNSAVNSRKKYLDKIRQRNLAQRAQENAQ